MVHKLAKAGTYAAQNVQLWRSWSICVLHAASWRLKVHVSRGCLSVSISHRVYPCLFVSIRVYSSACLSVSIRVYLCPFRVYPCLFFGPCLSVSIVSIFFELRVYFVSIFC